MKKEEEQICKPSDGLFTKNSIECELCCSRYKEVCKIMAIYKGFKTVEEVDSFIKKTENQQLDLGDDIEW